VAGGLEGRVTPGLAFHNGQQRLTMTVTKRCDRVVAWSAQASVDLQSWPAGGVVTLLESPDVLTVCETISSPGGKAFLRPVFQLP
jgi:hypothetical protein